MLDIRPGDRLCLKKIHPCGGSEWRVIAVGDAVEIACLTCGRRISVERTLLTRRVRSVLPPSGAPEQ